MRMRNTVWSMAGLLALAVLATIMAGCQTVTDPTASAKTTEQKVYATYGTLTIFSERGAALIQDPSVPDRAKMPIAQAIRATKPVADQVMGTLQRIIDLKAELASGATKREDLENAARDLDKYYFELEPLVKEVVVSVTVGLRCYKKMDVEYNACVTAASGGAA